MSKAIAIVALILASGACEKAKPAVRTFEVSVHEYREPPAGMERAPLEVRLLGEPGDREAPAPSEIQRLLQPRAAELGACLDSKLVARAYLKFHIDGSVGLGAVPADDTARCLEDTISRLRFPRFDGAALPYVVTVRAHLRSQ